MNEENTALEYQKNKESFLDFLALMIQKYNKQQRKRKPKK